MIAQHHCHWLLTKPAAWKNLLQMVSKRFFPPVIAGRNLSCGEQKARKPIGVEASSENVYLVVLWSVRHANGCL